MIKRAVAATIACCLSLMAFTSCTDEVNDKNVLNTKKEVSSKGKVITNVYDDDFELNYPSPLKDINDMRSDNADFYKERLIAAGDSIAVGWSLREIIPTTQVIAKEGINTSGYSTWMYDTTGISLSMLETMKQVRPSLLYISLGMNDVGNIDSDTYISQYKTLLDSILEVVPDCYIVAANITPIAKKNDYPKVKRSDITEFNDKLRNFIKKYNKKNVIYFDVHSCLLDENGFLKSDYDCGDGLHLSEDAYKRILIEVTKRLNFEEAQKSIETVERKRQG